MAQTHTVGRRATTVSVQEDYAVVRYHRTDVVKWNDREIILNTGGWQTQTTKNRMNQASNQYNLGYKVYQRNFNWFVEYKGQTFEFADPKLNLER